ncbi:MAG: hypothetical protein HY272_04620 [Gammaproteobacteria bacterium]|nr:hypothetical protein [Gammaproteobacteria bacterium]
MAEKSKELGNLARIGKLVAEPGAPTEIKGLVTSGSERLKDARNTNLALSSRFDLAYNAAHAFSLAALRWHGYRSDSRYLVFQALPHTLGLPAAVWRVLAKAHEIRNIAEYEGHFDADETMLKNLIDAADAVRAAVIALPPLSKK